MKKSLIFIVILVALLCLFFVYNYFTNPEPSDKNTGFKGPVGQPSVQGPASPPPGR